MVKVQKCPNCGANLKLSKLTGILNCENCGSTFASDKKDIPEEFSYIDAGNKFLNLKEYKKAFASFDQACKVSPDNFACWLGLAKSITNDFSFVNDSILKESEKYIANAKKCALDENSKILNSELKNYYDLVENFTKTQNKEIKNNSIRSIFQGLTIAIFLAIAISGIVIILTKSNEAFIWKLINIAIILAINFVLGFIIFKSLSFFNFKEKHQIIISIIIFIIFIAIAVGINIFAFSGVK